MFVSVNHRFLLIIRTKFNKNWLISTFYIHFLICTNKLPYHLRLFCVNNYFVCFCNHQNSPYAIKLFDKILQKHPSSPRSIYGKALALDYLADQRRSNDILQQALKFYTQLFNMRNVPNALFEVAAERCINRMRFVGNGISKYIHKWIYLWVLIPGQYKNAINVHKLLIQRFPDSPKYSSDLAVTYLTINRFVCFIL